VAGNFADEDDIKRVVAAHKDRFGRMDVLINNAGVGIGGPIEEHPTKKLDIQLGVNVRGVYITLRESIPLLKEAGAEHGKALVVNTASLAGKFGAAGLAAYSACKHAVVGLSLSAHGELAGDGIQVTALCPGFVATPMTDWVEGQVPKDQMIQAEDLAAAVRFLLATSPACIVPEIQFTRASDAAGRT
jgi:NAD(P)-dependent dehydrogenase (short-subunit alcohol dehydrogenase family)